MEDGGWMSLWLRSLLRGASETIDIMKSQRRVGDGATVEVLCYRTKSKTESYFAPNDTVKLSNTRPKCPNGSVDKRPGIKPLRSASTKASPFPLFLLLKLPGFTK